MLAGAGIGVDVSALVGQAAGGGIAGAAIGFLKARMA